MNRTALHQVCVSGLLRTGRVDVLLQGMASYDETLTLELFPPVAGLEPLRALPPPLPRLLEWSCPAAKWLAVAADAQSSSPRMSLATSPTNSG